jgi:hypothetical protein
VARIGINEKDLRRVEARERVKSKELKLADAASRLMALCQVPRKALLVSGRWV